MAAASKTRCGFSWTCCKLCAPRRGDFTVGARMNGDDFTPGGIDLTAACEIAGKLQRSGLVDYLNVSGMTSLQYPGWIADISSPDAMFADFVGRDQKPRPACRSASSRGSDRRRWLSA